jgi:hypothetical protein
MDVLRGPTVRIVSFASTGSQTLVGSGGTSTIVLACPPRDGSGHRHRLARQPHSRCDRDGAEPDRAGHEPQGIGR